MGKKYIIELDDNKLAYTAIIIDGVPYIKPLQLLPYTEPDMEQVRKEAYEQGKMDAYVEDSKNITMLKKEAEEAYDKGYKDAAAKISSDEQSIAEKAYQRGLSDAWEAARKISMAEINGRCSWKSMKNIFGNDIPSKIFKNFTASEAIESLKIYEQKHDGEIKIGDEVDAPEMKPFIVTGFGYGDDEMDVYCHGITTGEGVPASAKKMFCVRTGRHFPEIATVIKKMRKE